MPSVENEVDAVRSAARAAQWSAAGTWLQIVATFASLWIAWHTVEIAQQFKDEDRRKDELAISPYLSILPDGIKGSISARNDGLGPAVVERVLYQIDDQTIDIDRPIDNERDFQKIQDVYSAFIDRGLYRNQLVEILNRNKLDPGPKMSVKWILPGIVIPKDTEWSLVSVDMNFFDNKPEFRSELTKWQLKLSGRSERVNVQLCYCSMSGNSCFISTFSREIKPRPVKSCSTDSKGFSWVQ